MKKYIKPTTEISIVETEAMILAASPNPQFGDGTTTRMDSKRNNWGWHEDDDEEEIIYGHRSYSPWDE